MSRSNATATSLSLTTRGERQDYRLQSDIAQFCLPRATKDATQKLAYVNSICILVLVIGFIGVKAPQLVNKEPPQTVEIVPVEIVQIEQKPPEPEPMPENLEPPPDAPVDMPQIATVVAADPSQVKFAIPVEGPVVFAPAKFAQAPPPAPPKPATRTVVKMTGAEGGSFPAPKYPAAAVEQRLQGTVTLIITVRPDGLVESAEVTKSSGSVLLDRAAVQQAKTKYKYLPIS